MTFLRFIDVALVVFFAPLVIVAGAPALGYALGAASWIVARASGELVERKARTADPRTGIGLQVAGMMGRAIEPVIAPLGFDWKIGIGLVASFAAREVFVSTMSTVYNVGEYAGDESGTASLAKMLQEQKRPDGSTLYTPLLGITLMVFYVFALQCVSTVVIVRRETNSWRWPIFMVVYMTGLAYFASLITYQGGKALGFG